MRDGLDGADGQGFRDGDNLAFSTAVRAFTPRLLGVARRLTRDHTTAEDLVQDTWIAAYRHRASFVNGSLFAWLLVILRRCFLQQHRASERRSARELHYAREHASPPPSLPTADVNPDAERLFAAIERLSPRQRDVIVERIMGERSTADTARLLGIAEGTVKATLSQALHRLRLLLNETDDLS